VLLGEAARRAEKVAPCGRQEYDQDWNLSGTNVAVGAEFVPVYFIGADQRHSDVAQPSRHRSMKKQPGMLRPVQVLLVIGCCGLMPLGARAQNTVFSARPTRA
jgi:hypothetical protein